MTGLSKSCREGTFALVAPGCLRNILTSMCCQLCDMSCYNTSVSGLLGSSNKSAISVERIILGAYKKNLGRQHSLALVDPAPNFRGGAQTFVNPGGGGNTVETHTTLP